MRTKAQVETDSVGMIERDIRIANAEVGSALKLTRDAKPKVHVGYEVENNLNNLQSILKKLAEEGRNADASKLPENFLIRVNAMRNKTGNMKREFYAAENEGYF